MLLYMRSISDSQSRLAMGSLDALSALLRGLRLIAHGLRLVGSLDVFDRF